MAENLVGQKLPNIVLRGTEGKFTLPDDLKGQWTVLYFYPKDDTPGCTAEACAYRDQATDFAARGARVLGVSLDDVDSHEEFRKKYHLNFPLLSDKDHQLAEALGAHRPGRSFSRDTFLIDDRGNIRWVWRQVDPAKTTQEVRAKLEELKGNSHP